MTKQNGIARYEDVEPRGVRESGSHRGLVQVEDIRHEVGSSGAPAETDHTENVAMCRREALKSMVENR